jgi:hypothetical protein
MRPLPKRKLALPPILLVRQCNRDHSESPMSLIANELSPQLRLPQSSTLVTVLQLLVNFLLQRMSIKRVAGGLVNCVVHETGMHYPTNISKRLHAVGGAAARYP